MTIGNTFVIIIELNRGVAQLVARSVRDAEVVGSIPVASTKKIREKRWVFTVFLLEKILNFFFFDSV